ncbi:MAG: dihydrofolate reductase family protein [Alphaproteobacteria bacterium]
MKIYIAQTIDGYIAGPDGSLGHLDAFQSSDFGYDEFIASVDGLIMGRNTLEAFYGQHGWPYPDDLPAIIMTHRLLPRGMPEHVRTSESIEKAAELHPNAYVDGGHVIAQCLARGLIREARIFTLPILLGAGIPLFLEGATTAQNWTLIGSKSYPCGTVENHYKIASNA